MQRWSIRMKSLLIRRKLRKRTSSRPEQIADAWALANAAPISEVKLATMRPRWKRVRSCFPSSVSWSEVRSFRYFLAMEHVLHLGRIGNLRLAFEFSTRASSLRREPCNPPQPCRFGGHPDSWHEEVCSLLKKIGDLKSETGDFAAALLVYEERVGTARSLMADHPHSAEWQNALAVSLEDFAAIRPNRQPGDGARTLLGKPGSEAAACRNRSARHVPAARSLSHAGDNRHPDTRSQ